VYKYSYLLTYLPVYRGVQRWTSCLLQDMNTLMTSIHLFCHISEPGGYVFIMSTLSLESDMLIGII